jgi:hypothetical protein
MLKVVVLSNDNRAAQQLRAWLRELPDDPWVDSFPSIEAFEKAYEQPLREITGSNATEGMDANKAREFLASAVPIRLLIVDLDLMGAKTLEWLKQTKQRLGELGHSSEKVQMRTLLVGYDEPNSSYERFQSDHIDDLILKPFDQALFQQKVELLFSDNPDLNPSFLYRTKAEGFVEIGKDAIIDELSESALSIRNPRPLAEGVYALIHSRAFSTRGSPSGRIIGRAYASVRHPQIENQWLVRFSLFGIAPEQLAEIRRFIINRKMPSPKGRSRPIAKRPLSASKDKLPPRHRFAVVEMNRTSLEQVANTIEENFERVEVTRFQNYTRFLSAFAKRSHGAMDLSSLVVAAEGLALPRQKTLLYLNLATRAIERFDLDIERGSSFFGRSIGDWLDRRIDFREQILSADRDDWDEFITYSMSGGESNVGLRVLHADGQMSYIEANCKRARSPGGEGHELQLDLREIDHLAWLKLNKTSHAQSSTDELRFEAIFIDASFVRGDQTAWLDGLHETMRQAGVIASGQPLPRIFLMADETSELQPNAFMHRGFSDFFFKPIDRKQVVQKLAALVPALLRPADAEPPVFVPCEITVQLCKTAPMEELSEYGLTVMHPTPIRPKSFMRFFSPLFSGSADGVIGRCTASLPSRKEGVGYRCLFVFFGASDELHKEIRNWIRDDYIHKKEVQGGS